VCLSAEAIEQMVADIDSGHFPLNSIAAFDVVGPGPDQGLRRARQTAETIKVGGVTNEQPNP
jgi:hypothetical protein